MQTRKEFCKCCVGFLLAGIGAPLTFGREEDAAKKPGEGNKDGKMYAYCGIVCSACNAYIATQKNDKALLAKTAKEWTEKFKIDVKPESLYCDGCPSNSTRLVAHCATCDIRKCAREKKMSTCAACPEYSCAKLEKFLAMSPDARKTLEKLRQAKKSG
jgi:hypothetical protein